MDRLENSGSVVELFEAQVRRTPRSTGLAFEGRFATYEELNARSNQLARFLRRKRVGREVVVGVQLSRSAEIVVALLGILKAGGAYLPLEPTLPPERLAFLIEDADTPIVLTEEALGVRLPSHTQGVALDSEWCEIGRESGENLQLPIRGEDLAYLIYTSGSTGRPKGVAIEQRNLAAYVRAVVNRLELPSGSSFAHVSTFAADLGNTALFPALCTGGTLHVISADRTSDGEAYGRYCERYPIDVLKIAPTHLGALLDGGSAAVLPRRCLVLGGESLSWKLIARIRDLSPSCAIFNHYGPTETTVGAIAGRVGREMGSRTVPLGTPLRNSRILIVDTSGADVADGEAGELVIGGDGVGRGYWKDPELTGARFVSDPSGRRAFRTGDRARRLRSGQVEFLGRFDHQVKIRGFRVELGEIEAVLAELGFPAAVVACEDATGEKRLVAYVVCSGSHPLASELRELLRPKLPEHMVPSVFVPMSTLPQTANGKIDRQALPAPPERLGSESEYTAPRNETEKVLARLWEELFRIGRVGVRDNFFDLGGHSLVAAQMTNRILKHFGKKIPATIVLQAPTVEQIALALEDRELKVSRCLVPIQPEGKGFPLFCPHAGMGTVHFYYEFAKTLGQTRPIYALRPPALDDDLLPYTRIEQMGAAYVDEIRTVQPHGPYHLLGWCFGGVLALEMAQQLRRAGEQVAFLCSMNGGFNYSKVEDSSWVERQVHQLTRIPPTDRLHRIVRKIWRCVELALYDLGDEAAFRIGEACRVVRRPIPRLLRGIYAMKNHKRLARKYVPRHYPGDLVLFLSNEKWVDPLLGWRSVISGRIELHQVPFDYSNYRGVFWQSFAEWSASRRSSVNAADTPSRPEESVILRSVGWA